MAHYASGQGQYQDEYRQLWKKLVPESGKAETLQGEAVRIIGDWLLNTTATET